MIKHIKCDIFESGADIICHQVNCQGAMNSGVAKQVRERYPIVFKSYKALCSTKTNCTDELLGTAQVCRIGADKYVVNLFAQNKFGYDGKCYTDYEALEQCLQTVKSKFNNNVIAIPYLMACHRGGGDWNVVYKMIEDIFGDSDYNVLICEYDGG